MSLSRTALRLCVAALLKGSAASRPTIAENRVYDSRISDLAPETVEADAKPTIIVLTDGDEGEALSKQNGGPPFRRNVDLVLELAMVQAVRGGDASEWVVGYPDTDARHEASLDFIEFQILQELSSSLSPLAIAFRKFARIVKEESHRQVLDDSGVKLACRIVTLTCDVAEGQMPIFNSSSVPVGAAALPEPLRSVAALLPEGSSGADGVKGIVAALTPKKADPLAGIDIVVDANPGAESDDDTVTITFDPQEE